MQGLETLFIGSSWTKSAVRSVLPAPDVDDSRIGEAVSVIPHESLVQTKLVVSVTWTLFIYRI
jgi:hypothetical protein